jgi:hypothetical protein
LARARVAGSDVTLVHVVHPWELDPPAGAWQARDPEMDHDRRPLLANARAPYRRAFDAFRADFSRRVLAAGARYLMVPCDDAPATAVRRLVQLA